VRELYNIKYYDDSFGTTPDTSIVAMDSFLEPKVMIVGGHDKGNDFTGMINRLSSEDIRGIVCLGPTGAFIANKLIEEGVHATKIVSKEDYNNWTMPEIVAEANILALKGDIVLLSTGSASFGIFKDYKDRGNQFIDVVNSLQ
jgi:UDP-N-acetylmuramoylalanine--D-glutamate ligase